MSAEPVRYGQGMGADCTLEWFGCTTFRVRVAGLTLWFDTFVDRAPGAEPVGMTAEDIDTADMVFVSHAHFDHLLGADVVAGTTGAPVVGSCETARILAGCGLPEDQLWRVAGGERVDCGRGVSVRVLPSLHSCLFAASGTDAGAPCLGELGLSYQERRHRVAGVWDLLETAVAPEYFAGIEARASHHDGGQLNYLLETPDVSMLVCASSGYWSGIHAGLQPDVALLAAAGRPNVDGEPYQGSLADFMVDQVELLRPRRVVLCHHDAWMPPLPALDVGPITAALAERTDRAQLVSLGYGDPYPLARP